MVDKQVSVLLEQSDDVRNLVAMNPLAQPNAIQNPAILYLRSLGSLKSQKTMYSFLSMVAQMVANTDVVNFDWGALRRHHIHSLIGMLRESARAPATINTYLSALKGVAMEAWTLGKIDTDSFQHIKLIKSVKGYRLPKGRSLTKQEIKALFGVCDNDASPKGIRDSAIISVLIGCGLRRSEIVALDLSSVKPEHTLYVLGKGNKERISFMPAVTWNRLQTYIEMRGKADGALFLRIRRFGIVTAERLTDQAVYHILDTRRLEAGIEAFTPHDLRRSFASMMLENGEDIITVKDAMGHASVLTTQRYDRRSDSRLRNAADALDF